MSSGLPLRADIARFSGHVANVPTTDIIGALDTVNSLYEEPFFSCRQGGGSPPPAATGSPSPIRAVSEQHLHAVLSLVRRTGRRSSVPLASRPSGNRFSRFPTNMARGVPGWLVVPREQSVTLMSPEAMHAAISSKFSYCCRFCIALAGFVPEDTLDGGRDTAVGLFGSGRVLLQI